MPRLGYIVILLVLSVRSIFSHKLKSMVVGFLVVFGTVLVVVGTSLLDSIEDSMSKSITSSLAGHLQVHSAKAKDPLALFGGMMMGAEDIGRIADFETLKQAAEKVDNVKAVVPMGIDIASVMGGNEVDRLSTELRDAVKQGEKDKIERIRRQLLGIGELLKKEIAVKRAVAADSAEVDRQAAALDRLAADELWAELETDPERAITFIETQIAPLSSDGSMLYLRYVGTDLERFKQNFDRFEIVKGEMVPPGRRGFLFADKFYEDQIKHKVARDFDKIHRQVVEEGKSIAEDSALRLLVKSNARQYRRITYQLDPEDARRLEVELVKLLPTMKGEGGKQPDLSQLLEAFLTVDDSNVRERHKMFYDLIAPMIELYQVRIGDVMTIRAYTRAGYLKAVNTKVWGTFNFRGLEKSDLAAAANLMDIVTFRDLYGLMSDKRREELAEIKKEVGAAEVGRQDAEAALFGGGGAEGGLVQESKEAETGFDEFAGAELAAQKERATDQLAQVFDNDAINRGVALNAAVILEDPRKLEETQKALGAAFESAGLDMKIVDWQTASGIVGQFIIVIRMVLYIAIGIIFLVALVIINNTMVMATMERTAEIGTMRAIGAKRSAVMTMFLFETVLLGVIAGAIGAAAGMGAMAWLGSVGIPAGTQDVLIFLFGGPRMYPSFGVSNVVGALVAIFVVSLISTLYPARLATRILPVVAMQGKD